MQLPAIIDKSLEYCGKEVSQEDLFNVLVKNPPDLIQFTIQASEDETWALQHHEFMSLSFKWLTEQFYQDRLLMDFAKKITAAIQDHYGAVEESLPLNLTVKLRNKEVKANGILYGSASEFMREMIRRECRDKKQTELNLEKVSYVFFDAIEEFLTRGTTHTLMHKEQDELTQILDLALLWELEPLAKECQTLLKNYVSRENLFDIMLKAHKNRHTIIRQACFDLANSLDLGYRLEDRGAEYLGFEFLEFNENSFEAFKKLRLYITHLICSGRIAEESDFVKVVKQCPNLVCLDLSGTVAFSDFMKEIPPTLPELALNACPWLNDENFAIFVEKCPKLNALYLGSAVKLGPPSWGLLQQLDVLRNLDLSRCSQLGDEELRIILQACKELVRLTLEDCRSLTDEGFYDIPKFNNGVAYLNLKNCRLTDLPLVEIAVKCDLLTQINLSHCEFITDTGLLELARNSRHLRLVDVSHCKVSKGALDELRKIRPYLTVVR